MSQPALQQLADYLSGEFENAAQAAAQPAWYVHLKLWQRLVPQLSDRTTKTFFLEQANAVSGQPPYRQRIFQISTAPEGNPNLLKGQYYAVRSPLSVRGGGSDPTQLKTLTTDDLVALPNSGTIIQSTPVSGGQRFQSALKDGQYCSFEYDGQQRYVYLGFDIEPNGDTLLLKTYDKGIDPDTGRGLWGALMGPFEMVKQQSYPA